MTPFVKALETAVEAVAAAVIVSAMVYWTLWLAATY